MVCIREQELWVIDCFVNLRWFRGKFQLKIRWEDQAEEQDDWWDFKEILAESARWREELNIDQPLVKEPTQAMIEDYYNWHPNAPRHDDPIH